MRIAESTVHQLTVPLTVPYHLAFGDVRAFETIVVETRDDEGRWGVGEATLLTGYTAETPEQSWLAACTLADRAVGIDTEEAKVLFEGSFRALPFTVTALTTAVEMLEGHEALAESGEVTLLGLVNATEPAAIEREVEERLAEGYTTLKVKVGWEAEADLARVRFIREVVAGRAKLRIDANQGYTREEAIRFVGTLEPDGIELVEQTCPAGDWEAARAVRAAANVPVMLDESIYFVEDIDRAAELEAADFIKLKLMKTGGLTRLAEGLQRIRDLGITPVLGNGVATDLGCWMEACIARRTIDNAGEMNGLLKIPDRLLQPSPAVEGAAMVLRGDMRPRLDASVLAAHTRRSARFPER